MCMVPGAIKMRYDKDDPSTWAHWQTAEQKSTEEGRMTNPFATEDNRYDELSGRTFSIQTQPGGKWGSNAPPPKESRPFQDMVHFKFGKQGTHYGDDTVWQAMREIDHRYELADIKKRSQLAPIPGSQGSGRGYSASSRSGRGAAPSNGLGISTGSLIERRGSK